MRSVNPHALPTGARTLFAYLQRIAVAVEKIAAQGEPVEEIKVVETKDVLTVALDQRDAWRAKAQRYEEALQEIQQSDLLDMIWIRRVVNKALEAE